MSQAYVINGVVISDDGNIVQYRTRCPRCGDINQATIYSCSCLGQRIINLGAVPCARCSNMDKRTYSFTVQVRREI